MRIIESIKSCFKKNTSIEKVSESILKNKKITDNVKFENLLQSYGNYFKHDQVNKVDLEVYENDFEYIIIDGFIHHYRYEKAFKETEENDTYIVCKQFVDQVKTLKNFNKHDCNNKQLEVVNKIKDLANKYSTEKGKNGYESIIESCNALKTCLISYVTPEQKKESAEEENLFGF